MPNCPCGTNVAFENCCEKIHHDHELATHPEQLMRARYSAFVVKNIQFLIDTLDVQIRTPDDFRDYTDWANKAEFHQLKIINSAADGNKGKVEFEAHYTENAKKFVLHEVSHFRKQKSLWYYRNGKVKVHEDSSVTHSR